mgnify:CR=1 FL=1
MTFADGLVLVGEFFLCLLGVAFFTGFESAFAAMNKVKLRHKVEQEVYGADFLELLYNNREKFLGFTLVGMTLAFVGGTVVAVEFFRGLKVTGVISARWVEPAAALAVMPLMLMFGELLPRTYARRYADRAVFYFVRPVMVTYAFFYVPLVIFTSGVTRLFMWILGTERSGLELRASKEELRLLVRLGEKEGIVEKDESELIESIFDFQRKTAGESLTPRVDVKALPKTSTVGMVARMIGETGHSRIPIFEEDLDHIVGIVHAYDVLTSNIKADASVESIVKKIASVPASKSLTVLLREFQATRNHMAVVVGEHGETVGLITMEDVLEEVVGEIRDEYDAEESAIVMVSPSVYLVDARVSRSEFEREFSIELPDDSYDTFGGFLLHLWRRIPSRGEEKQYGGLSISIVKADAHRVHQARVIELPTKKKSISEPPEGDSEKNLTKNADEA